MKKGVAVLQEVSTKCCILTQLPWLGSPGDQVFISPMQQIGTGCHLKAATKPGVPHWAERHHPWVHLVWAGHPERGGPVISLSQGRLLEFQLIPQGQKALSPSPPSAATYDSGWTPSPFSSYWNLLLGNWMLFSKHPLLKPWEIPSVSPSSVCGVHHQLLRKKIQDRVRELKADNEECQAKSYQTHGIVFLKFQNIRG